MTTIRKFVGVVSILLLLLCRTAWSAPRPSETPPPKQEPSTAKVPPSEDPSPASHIWKKVDQFRAIMDDSHKTMGHWEYYSTAMQIAIERIWQEHGTESDSDRFTKDLAIRIVEVPPWKLGHIDRAVDLLQSALHSKAVASP